jgi:deazaflavin-dependent oxidoreductase (nitroreductase family)
MAKTAQAPRFVRAANILTKNLLRAGLPLSGYGAPMYLLTVRGRKSGQPRTTPISVIEHDGKRYLLSPFGMVDWVRNLRASSVATLTRRRRVEQVAARELSTEEASELLRGFFTNDGKKPPIIGYFGVTAQSSPEEFKRAAASHPAFVLETR